MRKQKLKDNANRRQVLKLSFLNVLNNSNPREIKKQKKKKNQKSKLLTRVGFEPTPPKRLVPKTSALDHWAISPRTNPFS